jgi:Ribbon-helix-helix protein, copG family
MKEIKTQCVEENRPERLRFQLELSRAAMERLDELVTSTDSSSRAEVIRRALGFYELLIEQTKAGRGVEIVDDRGNRQQLIVL